jgi:hypothetical protein
MTEPNNSTLTPFEACFAWSGDGHRVVAVYAVEPENERPDGGVQGRIRAFVQCRINEDATPYRSLEALHSTSVRGQVQRLIGRSLEIPRGVRLSGVLYLEQP